MRRASSSRQHRPGSDEFNQQWELCVRQKELPRASCWSILCWNIFYLLPSAVSERIFIRSSLCSLFLFCFSHLFSSPQCLMHFSSSAFTRLCLSHSFPKFSCVEKFGVLTGAFLGKIPHQGIPPRAFQWGSEGAPALSCISMRDQLHPPQSSMDIPGTASMSKEKQ